MGSTKRASGLRYWAVEWRGKITRDVGTEYEWAASVGEAREMFLGRHPMREVLAISRVGIEKT